MANQPPRRASALAVSASAANVAYDAVGAPLFSPHMEEGHRTFEGRVRPHSGAQLANEARQLLTSASGGVTDSWSLHSASALSLPRPGSDPKLTLHGSGTSSSGVEPQRPSSSASRGPPPRRRNSLRQLKDPALLPVKASGAAVASLPSPLHEMGQDLLRQSLQFGDTQGSAPAAGRRSHRRVPSRGWEDPAQAAAHADASSGDVPDGPRDVPGAGGGSKPAASGHAADHGEGRGQGEGANHGSRVASRLARLQSDVASRYNLASIVGDEPSASHPHHAAGASASASANGEVHAAQPSAPSHHDGPSPIKMSRIPQPRSHNNHVGRGIAHAGSVGGSDAGSGRGFGGGHSGGMSEDGVASPTPSSVSTLALPRMSKAAMPQVETFAPTDGQDDAGSLAGSNLKRAPSRRRGRRSEAKAGARKRAPSPAGGAKR